MKVSLINQMENTPKSVDQPRRGKDWDDRLGGHGGGGVGGRAGGGGGVVGRPATAAAAAVGAVLENEAAGLVEALLDDDSLGVELVLYLR